MRYFILTILAITMMACSKEYDSFEIKYHIGRGTDYTAHTFDVILLNEYEQFDTIRSAHDDMVYTFKAVPGQKVYVQATELTGGKAKVEIFRGDRLWKKDREISSKKLCAAGGIVY